MAGVRIVEGAWQAVRVVKFVEDIHTQRTRGALPQVLEDGAPARRRGAAAATGGQPASM